MVLEATLVHTYGLRMLENCKEDNIRYMFVLYFYTILIQHFGVKSKTVKLIWFRNIVDAMT